MPSPGCVTFDGDEALGLRAVAPLRVQVDGEWKDDISSDFGRIARQQDFIRRALQKALDRGARKPLVAKQLIDAALAERHGRRQPHGRRPVRAGHALRDFDPSTVKTYRVDGQGVIIGAPR